MTRLRRSLAAPATSPASGQVSLRTYLLVTVLLAAIPTIIVAPIVSLKASRAERQARADLLDRSAHDLAAAIDRGLTRDLAILAALARGVDGDPAFQSRSTMAAEMLGAPIRLRDENGAILPPASTAMAPVGTMESGQANAIKAAQRARLSGRAVVSDVIAPAPGMPAMVVLVVPVPGHQGRIATLDVQLPCAFIAIALREVPHPTQEVALLVDGRGHVAAASQDQARLVGQSFLPPASAEPSGWRGPEVPSPVIVALNEAPGWRVVSMTNRDAILTSPDIGLAGVSIAAGVATMLLTLGLTALLGEQLSRPLRAMAELARNIATGNETHIEATSASSVAEFEAVRQALLRANAVLRRRGAAERMALREARTGHELLVSVVNGTTESIYVKDLELRYVLVNRAALLSGPEPRAEWQVLGRGTADLFEPGLARRIEAADRTVLATGHITRFEQEYTDSRSGEPRWLSMTITPWQDAEGRVVGVVSVGRDITESRRADARLHGMQADLLRTTRLSAMGAMGSGLAHELNQPLAAATNFLNAGNRLIDRAMSGDAEALMSARQAVNESAQQLLRAGAIVRRLRDFVERGEVELQPHDLPELLREACELARNDASLADIDLRLCEASGEVMVDRTQIQQVLLNLIRNAGEAISAAPGDMPGQFWVSATKNAGGGICIDVSDNGPGLADGIAERLFQPFVSSKTTGMGIGLAICRTIVEGHGGMLTAERGPLGGMTFRITLPVLHLHGEHA